MYTFSSRTIYSYENLLEWININMNKYTNSNTTFDFIELVRKRYVVAIQANFSDYCQ